MKRTKGGKGMKKKLGMRLFVTALAVLCAFPALAIDPPPTPNPNGFISGPHYNLNIIGKKDDFVCPDYPTVDEYGNTVYGNVIFIPESGTRAKIYMQSGKGLKFATVPELQVLDPCTFDDGQATLQLPKSANGYWVFARALAKPGTLDDPNDIYFYPRPEELMAQDEAGNELYYQGSVSPDGEVCKVTTLDDGTSEIKCTLTRSRGQSKAVNITGIFDWTGSVCTFTDPADGTLSTQLCCSQADTDNDGALEYIDCYAPDEYNACPYGGALTDTYCANYTSEWIFNIADFVEYFWDVDNSGAKLVQIRFYPIPS